MNVFYKYLVAAACFTGVSSLNAQTGPTIREVRSNTSGTVVTATGVVTTGSSLGIIRYFEDQSAGLAAYGGNINTINIGDSITVTGILTEFNGLVQIGPAGQPPVYVNHGPARVPVTPRLISASSVNGGMEGTLVRLNNMVFVETGAFASNSNYTLTNGTQSVQLRSNSTMNGALIPTGPQSVVGVVGRFRADYQILPRTVTDITPYVAPVREIEVLFDGVNQVSGSTVYFNGPATKVISVKNEGTGALTVSSIAVTGVNASNFAPSQSNLVLNGVSSSDVNLVFSTTNNGSHTAVLTIDSDDADEGSFVLNIVAGGADGFMSEPTTNGSDLTFSNVKAYTFTGNFSAGTNAAKYIVLWKEGSDAPTTAPTDGSSYKRGDEIGDAKVAYIGTATSFTPRGIRANKDYSFSIYPFNGQFGSENYLISTPLSGTVRSAGANVGNYYASIDTASANFLTDLQTKLLNRNMITYYNYKQTFVETFELRDTTDGKSFIECRYSKYRNVFDGVFDWVEQDFSREHVYPQSWMPGGPYSGNPEKKPFNDQHILFPVRQSRVNATRSNYPFGDVAVLEVGQGFMGTGRGNDANGNSVYMPTPGVKGDAARAMFYEIVAYNNFENSGSWGLKDRINAFIPYGQDPNVLLEWHFNDLPDSYEIARHEYVASIQNNRNPFIDNPSWACLINFKTVSKQVCNLGADQLKLEMIEVYPNPASTVVTIDAAGNTLKSWEIVDIQGRSVLNGTVENNEVKIDVKSLLAGTYIVRVSTDNGTAIKKLMIQ